MLAALSTRMRIAGVRKLNPSSSERAVAPERTLRHATRIAASIGVTRLADITGLDRIGIPVHSAILPRSPDRVSIYNGKGLTAADSRASALMEAIERQTAIHAKLPIVEGSYRKLRDGKIAVTNPESFNHKLVDDYSEDRPYWWIQGYDFLADESILAPAGLAGLGPQYVESCSPYEVNSSNGLASGNSFAEAMCHALCELLERDAWTLADLESHWIPFARAQTVFGAQAAAFGLDDPTAYPRINLRDAGEPLLPLIQKFENAGLCPVVRDITSDFGIPCVMASVADDCVPGFPQSHGGMGAHPNARIAVIRALTELAQSRAADIQGVREDLLPAGIAVHPAERKMQRVQKIQPNRWMLQQSGIERPIGEMPSAENEDILEDIRLVLSRLERHGIERVVVVDLSEPDGIFSVVRVLVPGLEFWALDQGKLGHRATKFWQQHV